MARVHGCRIPNARAGWLAVRLTVLAVVAGALLAMAPTTSYAAGADQESLQAKSQQVDALFASVLGKEAPGAAVVVIQNGRILHKQAYGLANLELGVPNTPQTKFRLASVTKQFTAAAILQLQEAGALSLDDPVAKSFPDIPQGDKMTLRHLLTHTSGIRDSEYGPLEFPPGERMNYTNADYKLLGRIIEKVSGLSYEEYMRQRIFEPLAMANSGCDHQSTVLKNRASGYAIGEHGEYINAGLEDMFRTYSAGCLYSTVEDMYLWDQALCGEKLLKRATIEQAFTPAKLADGTGVPYGLGWVIARHRGLREISHGGDATGFNSWIDRFPDQQFTVIVLSNISMRPPGPLPTATALGRKIAEIYLGDLMAQQELSAGVTVAPKVLETYVGRYRIQARQEVLDVSGDTLTITLEDGRLYGQDKVNRIELCPESDTEFFVKTDNSTKIRFVKDASGRVTGLVAHLMGVVEIQGTRVE